MKQCQIIVSQTVKMQTMTILKQRTVTSALTRKWGKMGGLSQRINSRGTNKKSKQNLAVHKVYKNRMNKDKKGQKTPTVL